MYLLNNRIFHHNTVMQLQHHNPNKFKLRGTLDIVALKVDESVLMATLVLLKK